jgi:hypothetical protein
MNKSKETGLLKDAVIIKYHAENQNERHMISDKFEILSKWNLNNFSNNADNIFLFRHIKISRNQQIIN